MQPAPRTLRTRTHAAHIVPLKRARFWVICLFFFSWAGIIGLRLFWLQIVRHKEFVVRAEKQQQRTFEVAPRRGVLYDRNLHELAMTVQVDSIYADPSEIGDKKAAAQALATIVHTDPEDNRTSEVQIEARLNAGRNFAWIARRVTPAVSAAVHNLNMKGIYYQKEFQRFYPDNEIAAQVLGYVGIDDNGLGGLEEKFDSELHGTPGHMYAAMDARRKVLGSSERDPSPGRNMVLSIDENIQFLAERALDHTMEKTQAANGTVVVQDVHTGQILALAIRPTFNPNQVRHTTQSVLRDHAVSDVYEPGSTFKLVTYSAALDQHAITPDTVIDCHNSVINVAGRTIHDDKGDHFGRLSAADALAHSSNVGAIEVAQRMGAEHFYQYIRAYGFGTRSGIELPGETRGLLRPVNRWSPSSIASIAMGQEIAVTPVQLATMVSAIANGGVYLPPHILMPTQPQNNGAKILPSPFRPGADIPNSLPSGAHRVISTMASAQMRKMMEGVVLFGTGRSAQLNGYSAGGKTGTAQKIDPATHTYSKTMHVASFAGFAPVSNPVIAVAVIIDTPKGSYYGASVSAPVFAEVAQQVLEYLGVPHDTELHATHPINLQAAAVHEDEGDDSSINALYDAVNNLPSDDPLRSTPTKSAQPASASSNAQPAPPPVLAAPTYTKTVTIGGAKSLHVPSLTGLPVRRVIEQAGAAGLDVQIVGNGTCHQQAPAPGSIVPSGTRIVVRCGR